jgi:hypothetical protein
MPGLKDKLLCFIGRHKWGRHPRGFHQVCERCGKLKWVIGLTGTE